MNFKEEAGQILKKLGAEPTEIQLRYLAAKLDLIYTKGKKDAVDECREIITGTPA